MTTQCSKNAIPDPIYEVIAELDKKNGNWITPSLDAAARQAQSAQRRDQKITAGAKEIEDET